MIYELEEKKFLVWLRDRSDSLFGLLGYAYTWKAANLAPAHSVCIKIEISLLYTDPSYVFFFKRDKEIIHFHVHSTPIRHASPQSISSKIFLKLWLTLEVEEGEGHSMKSIVESMPNPNAHSLETFLPRKEGMARNTRLPERSSLQNRGLKTGQAPFKLTGQKLSEVEWRKDLIPKRIKLGNWNSHTIMGGIGQRPRQM